MEITGQCNIILKKKEKSVSFEVCRGIMRHREYTMLIKGTIPFRTGPVVTGHPRLYIIYVLFIMSRKNTVRKHFRFKTQLRVKFIKTCSHPSQLGLVGTSRIILLLLCEAACAQQSYSPCQRYTCVLFGALQLTLVKFIRSVLCGTCIQYKYAFTMVHDNNNNYYITRSLIFCRLLSRPHMEVCFTSQCTEIPQHCSRSLSKYASNYPLKKYENRRHPAVV